MPAIPLEGPFLAEKAAKLVLVGAVLPQRWLYPEESGGRSLEVR